MSRGSLGFLGYETVVKAALLAGAYQLEVGGEKTTFGGKEVAISEISTSFLTSMTQGECIRASFNIIRYYF